MAAALTTQGALRGRKQALVRIALLQARAAGRLQCPWAEATVLLVLTAGVQYLIGEGLLAFSQGFYPAMREDRWQIRVTSRGYDALPQHVKVAITLEGLPK